MSNKTTSISVSFISTVSEDETYKSLSGEINSADNADKTTYLFGETVNFRIYGYPESLLNSLLVVSTSGTVGSAGPIQNISYPEDGSYEYITFSGSSEASASKPIHTLMESAWVGTTYTTAGVAKSISVSLVNGILQASEDCIGVLKIRYKTKYRKYPLVGPADPGGSVLSVPVIIYILETT